MIRRPWIVGKVIEGRPFLPVATVIKGGRNRHIQALLDTGFDGDLALPHDEYKLLRSSPLRDRSTVLAGGIVVNFPRCNAQVRINNQSHRVVVLDLGDSASGAEIISFIGTGLLRNCSLSIDLRVNGEVVVERPRD